MFYWIGIGGKEEHILQIKDGQLPFPKRAFYIGIDLSNINAKEIIVPYANNVVIRDWATVGYPVVISEKLKTIIKEVNYGNAQFLPIIAEREDKKECHRLYVLNQISKVDAIDLENSVVSPIEIFKGIPSVIKAAIHKAKTNNLDFFSLENDSRIYVTERLKKMIAKAKLTGIEFVPMKETE